MKVKFLVIGKTTDKYLLPGIEEYNKRINRYCNYDYIELSGVRLGRSATAKETKNREVCMEWWRKESENIYRIRPI